ncbi:MAG: parC, partial [Phenylobacterium sp.]|nr:parC [Phenylobacterium sp.]
MNDITTTPPPSGPGPGDRIIDEPLAEALSRRYLAYALSVITDRALPDVRDGLKPVQRRVLYAMREMRLNPESAARKCAKVVGEVMGGYHPHGDQSIYDTLVR